MPDALSWKKAITLGVALLGAVSGLATMPAVRSDSMSDEDGRTVVDNNPYRQAWAPLGPELRLRSCNLDAR